MNQISKILQKMNPISLDQMDEVRLMNRVDTKFYFHERLLPDILKSIEHDYFVLEIDGQRLMPYESKYYDTKDFKMLRWHQNGKLNRFKIRNRKYIVSDQNYLEIKKKNNKGFTEKIRRINTFNSDENKAFVSENSPFSLQDLEAVISNNFCRIMLVNKSMNERVSIDLNLEFSLKNQTKKIDQLVLLERKSERQTGLSPLSVILKNKRIYPGGFSKYITGMYLFHENLKFNRFKKRFRQVNKTIEKTIL